MVGHSLDVDPRVIAEKLDASRKTYDASIIQAMDENHANKIVSVVLAATILGVIACVFCLWLGSKFSAATAVEAAHEEGFHAGFLAGKQDEAQYEHSVMEKSGLCEYSKLVCTKPKE